jgi:AraC family transcriptional regulator, exoenzyme S synthesis regulatory protein ExsA
MGSHATLTPQSDILFASCKEKTMVKEHLISEHVLAHIYSGSVSIAEAGKTHTFREGDTLFLRKNLLAKFINYPSGNTPFTSAVILFKQDTLQEFYAGRQELQATYAGKQEKQAGKSTADAVRSFAKHPALNSLFSSLLPYHELNYNLSEELTALKFQEALLILRNIDQNADQVLSDFSEPGKIDLATFMHKNFSYNVPVKKFAHLTGRSLAGFKRDFQKTFNTSPEKWLRQKRLERAHFLIGEAGKRPSEVYLEVGFENFSHFSFAFKKCFGYSPSKISLNLSTNNI